MRLQLFVMSAFDFDLQLARSDVLPLSSVQWFFEMFGLSFV